ncbi:MAG: hypothetical protein M3R63_06695 [Actinomycetota bacterium]|nr:hypothetical protein [Actinomycetota bacterium]
MDTATSIERTAVAARDHHGRPCTVTVERHRQAAHRLHYDGGEHTTALLTAEVVELLTIALAATGRTTIVARHPTAGACTLLVIARGDEVRLFFHAAASTSAVLDWDATARLRDALDVLR